MVKVNSPGVCATVKSKPRHVRRSLSRTSLDVKGSVVMEKVWMFEGLTDGISVEQLSEEDTGKDDWCLKHSWFLYTNLVTVQQCAKCSRRILPKRVAYKCTVCKRLCHLKCAIDNTSENKLTRRDKASAKSANAMDFHEFVSSDKPLLESCRYTKKTANRRYSQRHAQRQVNADDGTEELYFEQPHEDFPDDKIDSVDTKQQIADLKTLEELHSSRIQSPTRQTLTSIKHSIVKRCRSIKKKVTSVKNKTNLGICHSNMSDQTIQDATVTTSSSLNTEEQISQERDAWVQSPVRTRARERQLELRRQSIRNKVAARRSRSNDESLEKLALTNGSQKRNPRKDFYRIYDHDLGTIRDRLEEVEKRVSVLETAIPHEIGEWHKLKKKFDKPVSRRRHVQTEEIHEESIHETHPKHLEAMGIYPSASSGTTSDEVYLVPDQQSSSSQDNPDHVMSELGHVIHDDHVMHSPITSMQEDSLPSGIPSRLKLSLQGGVTFGDHHTSTPVTNREISFRSASRRYEDSQTIKHTSITHINMEQSYYEPCENTNSQTRSDRRRSNEQEMSTNRPKVLSPEQEGVRSFLENRRRLSLRSNERGDRRFTSPGRRTSRRQDRHSPTYYSRGKAESSPERRERSPQRLDRAYHTSRQTGSKLHSSPQTGSRSYSNSPLHRANQSDVYNSPPVASSTFREGNGDVTDIMYTDMSPVSYTFRQDIGDYSQLSFAKVASEETSKLEEAKNSGEKNTSSASNFSYTFRNDSQMIPTNADEDLPGFTRNVQQKHYHSIPPVQNGDSSSENENNDGRRITVDADIEMDTPHEHMMLQRRENKLTPTTSTVEEDGLSLTNVTAFTGDCMNSFSETVTSVKTRSRWVNKDVYMFEEAEQRRTLSKPRLVQSNEKMDETGDGRKPPLPYKRYSSSSEIDFLKEAEKHLELYKLRRSTEYITTGVCLEALPRQPFQHVADTEVQPSQPFQNIADTDSTDGVEEHIERSYAKRSVAAPKFPESPKQSPLSKRRSPSPTRRVPSPKYGSPSKKKQSPSPRKKPSPQSTSQSPKRRSQSPQNYSPFKAGSPSPKQSPNPGRSMLRSPSPRRKESVGSSSPSLTQGNPKPDHNSPSKSRSPSGSQKQSPNPVRRSRSPMDVNLLNPTNRDSIPLMNGQTDLHASYHARVIPKFVNSTTEFEDFERQLQEESMLKNKRKSQSLTNLQKYQQAHVNVHRSKEKSLSCTNSIDGETRSLINESARYHFLHDKGMIKISSPSLKLLNGSPGSRQRYEPDCKHIDEESLSVVQSGSESELSGVFVDNNFHLHAKTSEMGCKQTRSKMAESDSTATLSGSSDKSRSSLKQQQQQEREILEQCLKTVDEGQEAWDSVVNWMNMEYSDAEQAELERELDLLMEEEGLEVAEREVVQQRGPDSNSPQEESVYYSFQGQSLELRKALSPIDRQHSLKRPKYSRDDSLPGLMYIILHKSRNDVADYLNSDVTITENEIKEALNWAIDQQNFDITLLLLDDICKLIRASEGEMYVDVFPAYRKDNRWKPVFVILTKQNFHGEWDSFMDIPVYRRRFDLVSSEAAIVMNSDYVRSHPLSLADQQLVKRTINSSNLHENHSKITVINASPCRSKKNGQLLEKGVCIVIHCLIKDFIPFDEELFPRSINGIPVDVREGMFQLGVKTPLIDDGNGSQSSECKSGSQESYNRGSGRDYYEDDSRCHGTYSSQSSECWSGGHVDDNNNNCKSGSSSRSSYSSKVSSASSGSMTSSESEKSLTKASSRTHKSLKTGELKTKDSAGEENAIISDDLINEELGLKQKIGKRSNEINAHLLMGTSIGPAAGTNITSHAGTRAGSVGGFVLLPDGGIGFVTCAHIFHGTSGESRIKVCQPAGKACQNSPVCGEVVTSTCHAGSCDHVGVDAAVVRVTDRQPISADFVKVTSSQLKQSGFDEHHCLTFNSGKVLKFQEFLENNIHGDVIKVGATTGLTRGQLYSDGVFVRQCPDQSHSGTDERTELFNQFEILSSRGSATKFFDLGDSGALVFVVNEGRELACIGMAVGCTSYGSCIVTPIEAVFESLELPCQFVNFSKLQSTF